MDTDSLEQADLPDKRALDNARAFHAMGLPVFPVSIRKNRDGKWDKVPLVTSWQEDAGDPDEFDWDYANGCGIRMGDGWYALDIDAHKPGAAEMARTWIETHKVPRETRQHRTVSGGYHLIYRLPPGWEQLRTRANVVPGMDTRGQGGFIAFGDGYRVVTGYDREPAVLPPEVCKILDEGPSSGMVILKDLVLADSATVARRLDAAICIPTTPLARRWAGISAGMTDQSRSAMDMAVARLLAMAGFQEAEIVVALMEHYAFGQARWLDGWRGLRAARRCAARAVQETWRVRPPDTAPDSAEIEEAVMRLVEKQGKRT